MPRKATSRHCLILSTCPNLKTGNAIARALVSERLAACVNLIPVARSVYRWKGKIESAKEVLLVIKARRTEYRRIEERVKRMHPYSLPEIIAVDVATGSARYLAWIINPDKVK
jgi:periplasmic divalent cation tolerance protein